MSSTASAAPPRRAPAFQVEVGPQPALQALVGAVAGISAASLVAALAQHSIQFAWLFAVVPLLGWSAWRQARIRPRHLLWDGQGWRLADTLQDPGAAVQLAVLMDFDSWLLLRAQPGGVYLPLARRLVGPAWGQLRATLYSARITA